MSIGPIKTETPALEGDQQVIKKNEDDKLSESRSVVKDELRNTYAAQTVDTKIRPSQK